MVAKSHAHLSRWARNKLDSERSVASASVLRVDQLPSASDLPEELCFQEGSGSASQLEACRM